MASSSGKYIIEKLQHRRGFQGNNALEAAPVLGFDDAAGVINDLYRAPCRWLEV